MAYELVKANIPYRQVFKLPSPRWKLWSDWFGKTVDLRIEMVDPDSAPVAYEVRFGTAENPREFGYQIRSYDERLWWPLGGDYDYVLHPETFATLLEDGHSESLALLDPAFASCVEGQPLRVFPEEFRWVDHDQNNCEQRRAIAERGASKTIFCDDGVFVAAGEPILYAVPCGDWNGKDLSITVGVCDQERESNGTSHSEPGPGRLDRRSCACRGLAFDIGELNEAVRSLQARRYAVAQNYSIDILLERHRPETAPLMCARELARFLFAESFKDGHRADRLRSEIPVTGAARNEHGVDDLCIEALRQLCSSNDPVVAYDFFEARRDAKAILNRLELIGLGVTLAPEDGAALARLSL